MGNRITEYQAEKRRKEYQDCHHTCLVPELVNGVWRLCLQGSELGHIAKGRLDDDHEKWANYFPAGKAFACNHHIGWGHAQDRKMVEESRRSFQLLFGNDYVLKSWEQEAIVIMFSISYLLGQGTLTQIMDLMLGRNWYKKEMGDATLDALIVYKAAKIISVIPKKTFTKEVTIGNVSQVS